MTALFIGSHPDDIELAAGGLAHSFLVKGYKTFGYIATRNAVRFTGLVEESRGAFKVLGLQQVDAPQDFEPRDIPRQRLLDELINIRDYYKPDLVITHSVNDCHQDHNVVAQESLRAFKLSSIIAYTHPWNAITKTENNYYYELSANDVRAKIKALNCYKSQQNRHYFSHDVIHSTLVVNGMVINKMYAEAFESVRLINLPL